MNFCKRIDSIKYHILKNGRFRNVEVKLWPIDIYNWPRVRLLRLILIQRHAVTIEPYFVICSSVQILCFL